MYVKKSNNGLCPPAIIGQRAVCWTPASETDENHTVFLRLPDAETLSTLSHSPAVPVASLPTNRGSESGFNHSQAAYRNTRAPLRGYLYINQTTDILHARRSQPQAMLWAVRASTQIGAPGKAMHRTTPK